MSDPHSYAGPAQRPIKHLDWRVSVDFERQVLRCSILLHLGPGDGPVDLDTRELELHSVLDEDGRTVDHDLAAADPVLGSRLRLQVPVQTPRVRIDYSTSASSTALQWLTPQQTADGTHPFVFSQCQTIHARSMMPVPDSPALRFTFAAEIDVPAGFTVVMAATADGVEEQAGRQTYRFVQDRSIPAYLIALAAGSLVSRELSQRSRVWGESSVIERAAWEFAEVETLLSGAEQIMGPFPWPRADLLVMPPSYPYGGMENPQLMFLTPTLLAGDRSMVNVLCHEIVHHWTGNMVTCASLEHFWINEGFTVFGERKTIELIDGPEVAELQAAVGRAHLEDDLRYLAEHPELTRLRLDLDGLDPDVTSSWAALEKGYLFLRAIETSVGPDRFAQFLRSYLAEYAFRSVTGEEFVQHAAARLPGAVDWDEWLFGTGLPADAPTAKSAALQSITAIGDDVPADDVTRAWTADHWQCYLAQLSVPADVALLSALDDAYRLTDTGNHDTLSQWLMIGVRSGYPPATDATVRLVSTMGRLKDLKTLYVALAQRPDTRELAMDTFIANRDRYHPIAAGVVAERLATLGQDTPS